MWPVYRTGWIRIIIGKKRVSRDGRGLQNQRFCKFKGTAIGIFCHYGISPHRLVHRNRKVTASFTVIGIHLIPTAVEKGVINLRLAVLQLQVKRNACTDRKSTRLNSSHVRISYAVFCLKKKKKNNQQVDRKKHGGRDDGIEA